MILAEIISCIVPIIFITILIISPILAHKDRKNFYKQTQLLEQQNILLQQQYYNQQQQYYNQQPSQQGGKTS